MSQPPHTKPLSSNEVQVLSDLARFVDRSSEAKAVLQASGSLDEVIGIASSLGFPELSADLLIRANHHLSFTGWVWERGARSWSDHLFVLALTSLIKRQIERASHTLAPPWPQPAAGAVQAKPAGDLGPALAGESLPL
jgi:hypothetical protein